MRFNRAYELTITPNLGQPPIALFEDDIAVAGMLNKYQTNELKIAHPFIQNGVIEDGLTIQFSIVRGINVVNNKADISCYNVNPSTRKYLRQDLHRPPFVERRDKDGKLILDDNKRVITDLSYRIVELRAGYMGTDKRRSIFDRIFAGNIMEGYTVRQNTEVLTKLTCKENGFFIKSSEGFVNKGLEKASTKKDFISICLEKLGFNFNDVVISDSYKKELNDPIAKETHIGNASQLLRERFGLDFFLDNGTAYLLKDSEALTDLKVPLITSESGLLETPIVRDATLEVKTIFEPRYKLGHKVEIQSSIMPEFNGQYKITEIKHTGMISPREDGGLTTTLGLFRGIGGIKTF